MHWLQRRKSTADLVGAWREQDTVDGGVADRPTVSLPREIHRHLLHAGLTPSWLNP